VAASSQEVFQNRTKFDKSRNHTDRRTAGSPKSLGRAKEEEWDDMNYSNASSGNTEEEWTLLGLPGGEA